MAAGGQLNAVIRATRHLRDLIQVLRRRAGRDQHPMLKLPARHLTGYQRLEERSQSRQHKLGIDIVLPTGIHQRQLRSPLRRTQIMQGG